MYNYVYVYDTLIGKKEVTEKRKKSLGKIPGTEPMHSRLQKSLHYLTTKASYLCVWLPSDRDTGGARRVIAPPPYFFSEGGLNK